MVQKGKREAVVKVFKRRKRKNNRKEPRVDAYSLFIDEDKDDDVVDIEIIRFIRVWW